MGSIYTWLAGCLCALGGSIPDDACPSYVTTVTRAPDGALQQQVEHYIPKAGDIVCYNDHNKVWHFLYKMVGSDIPDHAGLIVGTPDGGTAVLESAPDDGSTVGPYIFLMETLPRFNQYRGMFHGCIYIRRLRCPLTPEQSETMTEWARCQCGKRYPFYRMLLQGTPCKCRKGIREYFFAKTDTNRRKYMCSELAIAALAHTGVLDPKIIKGNRIYPRDILYDDFYDLSDRYLPAAQWTPEPPKEQMAPIEDEIPCTKKHGKPCCLGGLLGR
jgi:hypothetical protein